MGEVLSLAEFRDRRGLPEVSAPEIDPEFRNKSDLHEHLRTMHGYGGPRSQKREHLDRVHDNRHGDPDSLGTPHSHR